MMVLLPFLFSISLSFGIEYSYLSIGDFNTHLKFLNQRAETLGWSGQFKMFGHLQKSPVFLVDISNKDEISYRLSLTYYADGTDGQFFYLPDSLFLNERWDYKIFPLNLDLRLRVKSFLLTTGFQFIFSKLEIMAEANYELPRAYPLKFYSTDCGIELGIFMEFKRLHTGIFTRHTKLSYFQNSNGYLHYDITNGYIYQGPPIVNSRRAMLDLAGFGLRILFHLKN